jgi:uncharacterized caspase-like protein
MRTVIVLAICIFFTAALSAQQSASPNRDLTKHARALEAQSVATLGIGLRSVGLLFQADPRSVFAKSELVKRGDWSLLQELERKGFVTVTACTPPQCADEFASYILTAQGTSVVSAIRGG